MLSFLVAVMSYYYFYFFYVLLLDDRNLHLNTRRFSSSLSVFGRPIFSMFTTMQFCLKNQKKKQKRRSQASIRLSQSCEVWREDHPAGAQRDDGFLLRAYDGAMSKTASKGPGMCVERAESFSECNLCPITLKSSPFAPVSPSFLTHFRMQMRGADSCQPALRLCCNHRPIHFL